MHNDAPYYASCLGRRFDGRLESVLETLNRTPTYTCLHATPATAIFFDERGFSCHFGLETEAL